MDGRADARACSTFLTLFHAPTQAHVALNVTSTEKRGRDDGCPAVAGRRRRHRDEAAEGEEGDATPDLLIKHLDVTLAIFV
jgi:hypothetical protein